MKGGDFYFTGTELVTVEAPTAAASSFDERQMELSFWNSIEDSTDPASFEVYLDEYPSGKFAALARLRIKQFGNKQAEAQRLAAKEESRSLVEAEAKRLAAEEEARRLAATEAQRLAAEEVALRLAEVKALRLAVEEETRRLAEIKRHAAEEEAQRKAEAQRLAAEEEARRQAEAETQQETQTALLAVPPVSSIVVDKTEVENDDRLKSVIKKHFKGQGFMSNHARHLVIASFGDVSVKSISGTTFIIDIEYRQTEGSVNYRGFATAEIEKTANSYKIISFDRKR